MVHVCPCCKESYKCFQTMASHLVNCRKVHRRRLHREARIEAAAAAAATADAASQDAALHDATKVVAETLDLENASGWARSNSKENFKCHIKRALNMSDEGDYRCFVGGLSWSTSNRALKDAFSKFGHLVNAKVVLDKESGRSRGFGFITFDNKHAMDDAIEAMDGINLHGRNITVAKAQPRGGSGRNYDGDHSGPGGGCFKCGKPGHFARECLTDRDAGGSYAGRDDRYGGIHGSGCARFGPDSNGDRNSGRSRDSGRGGDRNSRDRSGLYEHYSGSRKNKMSK